MVLPITAFLTLGTIIVATNAGVLDFKKLLNSSDANAPDVDEFAAVMDKFKFQPSNASDIRRRLGNFRKSKKNIEGLRGRFKNAKFGVNKFSLMSTEEQQQFLGATTPDDSPEDDSRGKRSALDDLVSTVVPEEFDFRAAGKVSPVKNQHRCGSCWAFTSAAIVESQYLLRFNQSLDLSEQNLVSCNSGANKCKGGDVINTLKHIQKNGITTESCQPYLGSSEDPCPIGCNERYYIGGYRNYGKDESTFAAQLYNYGPASVVIYVPQVFMSYKSGVLDFPAAECKENKIGKHGMVIVGYTADYWIIKNSWGPDWGENGFVRVKRGQNFCGMTMQVTAPFLNSTISTKVVSTTTTTTTTKAPINPSAAPSLAPGSCSKGDGKSSMNDAMRNQILKVFNEKRSEIAKGKFVMKNGITAPAGQNINKLKYNCSLETATQNFLTTCYTGFTIPNTYTNTLAFENIQSINETISQAPIWLFSFTVAQEGVGPLMIVTNGDAAFANADATQIGCAYTNTPCTQMQSQKTIFACTISPPLPPFSSYSPLYTMGNGCTSNSECTKPGYNKCDTKLKLCYA